MSRLFLPIWFEIFIFRNGTVQIATVLSTAIIVTLGSRCICDSCGTDVLCQPLVKIFRSARDNLYSGESTLHQLLETFIKERIHSDNTMRVGCALMSLPMPKNETHALHTKNSLTEDYDVLLTTVTIIRQIRAAEVSPKYASRLDALEFAVYNVICSLNMVLHQYGDHIDRYAVIDPVVFICTASSNEEKYLRDFTLLQGIHDILKPLKNKYDIVTFAISRGI